MAFYGDCALLGEQERQLTRRMGGNNFLSSIILNNIHNYHKYYRILI